MVGSILTLLAIGVATGAGTHRNRFRPLSPAGQQPTGAEGPAGPLHQPWPANRKTGRYRSSDSPFLPVRQERKTIPIAGNGKAHHRQGPKNMPTTELISARAELSIADRTDLICAVCPHEWDAHDPIGIRFCSATVAGQLHRGCVCVGNDCKQRPSITSS